MLGDPTSSSPSMNTFTPTGGLPLKTRSAARCSATPPLSSADPRAYSLPSRSVGSNAGEVQASVSPVGWTS